MSAGGGILRSGASSDHAGVFVHQSAAILDVPSTLLTPDSEDGSSPLHFVPQTSSTPSRNSVDVSIESRVGSRRRHMIGGHCVTEHPRLFRAPILGYEILEQRAKFTVFKIHVEYIPNNIGWFVFRRYTDFMRLNHKLHLLFPSVQFGLPPKRWLRDNFDPGFLEERLHGLQLFVNNVLLHVESVKSAPVRNFFCLDDPPGPHDSLEECRARCETLEEIVTSLKVELHQKQTEVNLLRAELAVTKKQRENSLKIPNHNNTDVHTGCFEFSAALSPVFNSSMTNDISHDDSQLYCTAFEDQNASVEGPLTESQSSNANSVEHGVFSSAHCVETLRKQRAFAIDSNGNKMVEQNGVVHL